MSNSGTATCALAGYRLLLRACYSYFLGEICTTLVDERSKYGVSRTLVNV